MLTGAFRVLNGDIPSKDFYANYGPAQFYVLAGLFRLFGTNVLTARIYDAAVSGMIVTAVHFLFGRLYPSWFAASCALSIAALLLVFQSHGSTLSVCILFTLLAAVKLSSLLASDSGKLAYLPVSISIAGVLQFRYDLAIIAAAAYALSIIVVHSIKARDSGIDYLHSLRTVLAILLVLVTVPVMILLWLVEAGILVPAVKDLLDYSGSNYVAMRSLPFPGPWQLLQSPIHGLAVYFPLAAVSLASFTMVRARREPQLFRTDREVISIIVFIIVTCCFFSKGWVRTSGEHMLFANVPAVALVFLCLHRLMSLGQLHTRIVAISLFVFALAFSLNWRSGPLYRNLRHLAIDETLPTLSGFFIEPDRMQTARYIAHNTQTWERIHSATARHDKIFANDVLIYFVTQRMPATRWHHYDPGVQTTRAVQQEIIRDLERNRISLLMRDSTWDDVNEPNMSSESSGVHDLDRYLDNNFWQEKESGNIIIFGND